jgi:DNA invertase Pin-like site-specific DNA recombinase
MKTYAYIRVSTDKQDAKNQRLEILEYARLHNIHVDEFIEITISSRQTSKERRIDELMSKLQAGDTLIVTELSRLGRSTGDVINMIKELSERQIRVILIKQNLDINGDRNMTSKIMVTIFSLLAELERDMISLRTKEALAAKKRQGIRLGKPVGTIQKSKFDKDRKKIEELLGYGLSVRKIAEVLDYPSHRGLNMYINKRIKKT